MRLFCMSYVLSFYVSVLAFYVTTGSTVTFDAGRALCHERGAELAACHTQEECESFIDLCEDSRQQNLRGMLRNGCLPRQECHLFAGMFAMMIFGAECRVHTVNAAAA